jgi:uncharacterized membrane protein
MATLLTGWVAAIASAWAHYMPIDYGRVVLLAAIAILSYILGYLCSQLQFPERPDADSKLPQRPDDLG